MRPFKSTKSNAGLQIVLEWWCRLVSWSWRLISWLDSKWICWKRSATEYLSSLRYILRCISNSLLPTLFSTTLAAQVFGTGHEKVEPVSQVLTFAMKQYNSTAPMCPDIFWLTQEAASWISPNTMGTKHIPARARMTRYQATGHRSLLREYGTNMNIPFPPATRDATHSAKQRRSLEHSSTNDAFFVHLTEIRLPSTALAIKSVRGCNEVTAP